MPAPYLRPTIGSQERERTGHAVRRGEGVGGCMRCGCTTSNWAAGALPKLRATRQRVDRPDVARAEVLSGPVKCAQVPPSTEVLIVGRHHPLFCGVVLGARHTRQPPEEARCPVQHQDGSEGNAQCTREQEVEWGPSLQRSQEFVHARPRREQSRDAQVGYKGRRARRPEEHVVGRREQQQHHLGSKGAALNLCEPPGGASGSPSASKHATELPTASC